MATAWNASGAGVDSGAIRALLPGKGIEAVGASAMKIAHCTGCNRAG